MHAGLHSSARFTATLIPTHAGEGRYSLVDGEEARVAAEVGNAEQRSYRARALLLCLFYPLPLLSDLLLSLPRFYLNPVSIHRSVPRTIQVAALHDVSAGRRRRPTGPNGEHLLSALETLGVDNCRVEASGGRRGAWTFPLLPPRFSSQEWLAAYV
ncbi:hypothetical protein GQ55_9G559800 [Panicum hallii var. hallii]|uniref:Uncharacterized protein n=1 Tax=Panicum hallii var. hallii TaxID=1504633 RepID=A0A2T7CFJ7_9POAL|nr:hypothetical protein GQ55_9G559800 [Panicum hallii var. hallii]